MQDIVVALIVMIKMSQGDLQAFCFHIVLVNGSDGCDTCNIIVPQ